MLGKTVNKNRMQDLKIHFSFIIILAFKLTKFVVRIVNTLILNLILATCFKTWDRSKKRLGKF